MNRQVIQDIKQYAEAFSERTARECGLSAEEIAMLKQSRAIVSDIDPGFYIRGEARDQMLATYREQLIARGLCPECGHVHYAASAEYRCDCGCRSRWFWKIKYRADETLWAHLLRVIGLRS